MTVDDAPKPRLGRRPDPLSDRATQALIRRKLCPRQSRDAQPPPVHDLLPPLTSRNDVDVELYALLAIVLRDSIQAWYGAMTPDESFVAEVVRIVAHCSRALEQRLRKLDLEGLLLDELPRVVEHHVAAHGAAVQPRLATDARQAYHFLWPLPQLAPVPRPGDARAAAEQEENEAAYRQLLVQAVLAVLLPTEDLENPCLTALVGQILAELVIGRLVVDKAAQPWLILEGICILARSIDNKTGPASDRAAATGAMRSIQGFAWSAVLLAVTLVSSLWLLLETLVTLSTLPSRVTREGDTGQRKPLAKVPVLDFAAWRCAGNLMGLGSRMPWLSGFLSLLQFGAVHGPGRVAGLDSMLDRLLSHRIHALFSPARLSAALRAVRGAVFPNNAPALSSLRAPSSDVELRALRRRAGSAIRGLLPTGMARICLGPGPRRRGTDPAAAAAAQRDVAANGEEEGEGVVAEVEGLLMVLGDEYCNKHLVYALLELLLVRLMPELGEKGVVELCNERLG